MFLCCKDTTKSNNRQIINRKSYQIGYYLTFINNKIKDYYIITYFLMLLVLLFVVSLYYIYTLLYIGKRKRQTGEKANGNGREDRRANRKEPGRRMPPTSSPVLPFRLPVPRSSLSFLPTERPAIAAPRPPAGEGGRILRTPPEAQRRTPSHIRAVGLLGEKVCLGKFCAAVSL